MYTCGIALYSCSALTAGPFALVPLQSQPQRARDPATVCTMPEDLATSLGGESPCTAARSPER